MTEPQVKLNEIQALKSVHVLQIAESERQAQQVEDALIAYNEIVDKLSERMQYLQSVKSGSKWLNLN